LLTKVHLKNYRVFASFELEFHDGLNILVGDNDSGKSTVLEAVRLALTGRLGDRPLAYALSPHLLNQGASQQYVDAIRSRQTTTPPELIVELYLALSEETAHLQGTNNMALENAPGLRVRASFNEDFTDE
jgi:putative ATP-dependent endonuclease of OLD family